MSKISKFSVWRGPFLTDGTSYPSSHGGREEQMPSGSFIIFFFPHILNNLLACNLWAGGVIVTLTHVLTMYHHEVHPSIVSHSSCSPQNHLSGFLICFHTIHKYIHHTHPPSSPAFTPASTISPSCFKVDNDCSRGLHLGVSHSTHCILIGLSPLLLNLPLSPCSPSFRAHSALLHYLCAQTRCVSMPSTLYQSLFLSLLPIVSSDRSTVIPTFSLKREIHVYAYIYLIG